MKLSRNDPSDIKDELICFCKVIASPGDIAVWLR